MGAKVTMVQTKTFKGGEVSGRTLVVAEPINKYIFCVYLPRCYIHFETSEEKDILEGEWTRETGTPTL